MTMPRYYIHETHPIVFGKFVRSRTLYAVCDGATRAQNSHTVICEMADRAEAESHMQRLNETV